MSHKNDAVINMLVENCLKRHMCVVATSAASAKILRRRSIARFSRHQDGHLCSYLPCSPTPPYSGRGPHPSARVFVEVSKRWFYPAEAWRQMSSEQRVEVLMRTAHGTDHNLVFTGVAAALCQRLDVGADEGPAAPGSAARPHQLAVPGSAARPHQLAAPQSTTSSHHLVAAGNVPTSAPTARLLWIAHGGAHKRMSQHVALMHLRMPHAKATGKSNEAGGAHGGAQDFSQKVTVGNSIYLCTSVADTLFSLVRVMTPENLLVLFDRALRRQLVTHDELLACARRRRWHKGVPLFRRLIACADAHAENPGESRVRYQMIKLGFKLPVLQQVFCNPWFWRAEQGLLEGGTLTHGGDGMGVSNGEHTRERMGEGVTERISGNAKGTNYQSAALAREIEEALAISRGSIHDMPAVTLPRTFRLDFMWETRHGKVGLELDGLIAKRKKQVDSPETLARELQVSDIRTAAIMSQGVKKLRRLTYAEATNSAILTQVLTEMGVPRRKKPLLP